MTIPAAVIACVRIGIAWETIALAYKLSLLQVEAIVREEMQRAKKARRR